MVWQNGVAERVAERAEQAFAGRGIVRERYLQFGREVHEIRVQASYTLRSQVQLLRKQKH